MTLTRVQEVMERMNPWIAMPVGLRGANDETLTRLKRLNEVLGEMQEQQLVPRERAWQAVLNIGDVRRMHDVLEAAVVEVAALAAEEAQFEEVEASWEAMEEGP